MNGLFYFIQFCYTFVLFLFYHISYLYNRWAPVVLFETIVEPRDEVRYMEFFILLIVEVQ